MKRVATVSVLLALAGAAAAPSGAVSAEPELETVRVKGGEAVAGEVIVRHRGERDERVLELAPGVGVGEALRELRDDPEVAWATPNPIARATRIPRDPGRANRKGGWVEDQWNFLAPPPVGVACSAEAPCGVNAVEAWDRLRRKGHPEGRRRSGKRGPIVAVVDTGVAYRKRGSRHRRSPDLARGTFVSPRDFIGPRRNDALDRNGHGTHIASTIAERTGNRRAVTGLGDGLRVMPVRVLDASGAGPASAVAKGIRYAARKGAKVINLSLEFSGAFSDCRNLRSVCRAIRQAQREGALVVAANGNARRNEAQMPAKVALGVAATTIRGCISGFSSRGPGTDISAPGGGADSRPAGSHCRRGGPNPSIIQLTLKQAAAEAGNYTRFGFPRFDGTSMAAAHVSGAAALVLASRVLARKLGHRPSPTELERWLECTARPPTDPATAGLYGAGILDLATALKRRSRCPALGL